MFALSLRKPYADWVLQGRKTIEIRHWNIPRKFKLPIRVFIHTSQKIDEKRMTPDDKLSRGCIVGKVTIIGVKRYVSLEDFERDNGKHLAGKGYYAQGRTYGFILEKAKLLSKPTPYKGRLGFFEVTIFKE